MHFYKKITIKLLFMIFGITVAVGIYLYQGIGFWGDILNENSKFGSSYIFYNNSMYVEQRVNQSFMVVKNYLIEINQDTKTKAIYEIKLPKDYTITTSWVHNEGTKYAYILLYGPSKQYIKEKVKGGAITGSYRDAMLTRVNLENMELEYLKEIKAVNRKTAENFIIRDGRMFYIIDNNLYRVEPRKHSKDILVYKNFETEYINKDGCLYKFDYIKEKYIQIGTFDYRKYTSSIDFSHFRDDYFVFSQLVLEPDYFYDKFYLADYNGNDVKMLYKSEYYKIVKNEQEYSGVNGGGFYEDIYFINDGNKVDGFNIKTREKVISFDYSNTTCIRAFFEDYYNGIYYFSFSSTDYNGIDVYGLITYDSNGNFIDEFTTSYSSMPPASFDDYKKWNTINLKSEGD